MINLNSKTYLLAISMSFSAAAIASPTVDQKTISWPDDGWYQVQQVQPNGLVEVCQGGLSCNVEPGEYIVINHTNGDRFENVVVGSSIEEVASVTVDGSTIRWPDDGWYQVQNKNDYREVCAGTSLCSVSPGEYIVINHSTGERFDNIVVADGSEPAPKPSPSGNITIEGNTISWANDGWYQVQSATSYATLCEGGLSCEVTSGEYIVINLTTGKRWENIAVGGGVIEPPVSEYDLPADSGDTPAPMGISIAVYGGSTAELNWIRPFYGDGITINEIWRDGVKLADIPGGGNSYLDTQRVVDQAYTYHIVALNKNGRKTTKFVETNGTVANPIDPVISAEETPEALERQAANLVHLISGTPMQRLASTGGTILDSTVEELGLVYVADSENSGKEYTCPNGGTILLDLDSGYYQSFLANNCAIESITISGWFSVYSAGEYDTRAFTLVDSRDNMKIHMRSGVVAYDEDKYLTSFSATGISVTSPNYEYTAESISVSLDSGDYDVAGNFKVFELSGRGFTGTLGKITRPRAMAQIGISKTANPIAGAIALNSMEVGNQTYGIKIDNGNPDTFTLNETIDGALTSYNLPWSDRMSLKIPRITDFDSGL